MKANVWQTLGRCCLPALLLMVWAFLQLSIAQEPAKIASPLGKGTLSGTVVGSDGKPIANVRVWANNYGNKLLAEARTNAEGHFRLGPVEPVYRHRFDLFSEIDGFARQYVASQTYSVYPGTDCDLGIVRMDRGRTYVGQVVDVDGKPRAGVIVECAAVRYSHGHSVSNYVSHEVKTDANGYFRSPSMPVASINFMCRAPERQLASHHLLTKLPAGEETLAPIRLEKDVPIHGIVKDEKGKPVIGAKFNASGVSKAITDADGKFTLRGFGPETYFQMQGSKEGHAFINWGVRVKKDGIRWFDVYDDGQKKHGPSKELIVVMKTVPKAWIEGTAVDAVTNKPVRIGKVVLCQLERKPNGEVERRG